MVHRGKDYPIFVNARPLVRDAPWPLWPPCEYYWVCGGWGGSPPPGLTTGARGLLPVPYTPGLSYVTWDGTVSSVGHELRVLIAYEDTGPSTSPTMTLAIALDGAVQGRTSLVDFQSLPFNFFQWVPGLNCTWIPAAGSTIYPAVTFSIDAVLWTARPQPTFYGAPFFTPIP